MFIKTDALSLGLTDDLTRIGNVSLYGREMAGNSAPLFSVRLRDENGAPVIFDAAEPTRARNTATTPRCSHIALTVLP